MDGNHGELYPKSHEFVSDGIPYIGANDFDNGRVNYKSCKYLTLERASKFKKGIAQNGDVLFAHNATVGPVAVLKTDLDYVILSTTATYFRCNAEKLNSIFLAKCFESDFFVRQYSAVMSQSTRNQVPILAQRKFRIVYPPQQEQNLIAKALSDTDALINELEKLIQKKQAIKTATMQQLLTGKTRLPQFALREDGTKKGMKESEIGEVPEDWEVVCLKSICTVVDSLHRTPSFSNNGYPMVRVADIKQGPLDLTSTLMVSESVFREFTQPYKPKMNDIVMSRVGSYGISSFVETPEEFCIGQNTVVITNIRNPKYLYLFLTSDMIKEQIENGSFGSGYKSLSLKNINDLIVLLPDEAEQLAISIALFEYDKEIQALKKRLDKTRQIKQGMMQELLTGRTRLIKPKARGVEDAA